MPDCPSCDGTGKSSYFHQNTRHTFQCQTCRGTGRQIRLWRVWQIKETFRLAIAEVNIPDAVMLEEFEAEEYPEAKKRFNAIIARQDG
jgi:hypothetical protein